MIVEFTAEDLKDKGQLVPRGKYRFRIAKYAEVNPTSGNSKMWYDIEFAFLGEYSYCWPVRMRFFNPAMLAPVLVALGFSVGPGSRLEISAETLCDRELDGIIGYRKGDNRDFHEITAFSPISGSPAQADSNDSDIPF